MPASALALSAPCALPMPPNFTTGFRYMLDIHSCLHKREVQCHAAQIRKRLRSSVPCRTCSELCLGEAVTHLPYHVVTSLAMTLVCCRVSRTCRTLLQKPRYAHAHAHAHVSFTHQSMFCAYSFLSRLAHASITRTAPAAWSKSEPDAHSRPTQTCMHDTIVCYVVRASVLTHIHTCNNHRLW